MLDSGTFILGPNVRAFEEEAAAYLGVPADGRRRQRNRRARARARRAGDRARRRGDLPRVHVLRDRRGDRAPRRDARLRRHRSRHAQPRSRGRGRADHRAHEGADARAPVRPAGAARRARRAGPADRRGRGAGLRRDRGRADRRRLDLQLLPDQEPVLPRRRRADRRPRRRSSPSGSGCSASTARTPRRTSTTSATTRASTSSRRPCCASSCTQLDGWNEARREAAARYAELGLGDVCELPADDPGHVYHMYVVRSPERDRIAAALQAGRDRLRRLLRDAAPPPARAALPRLPRGRPSRRPSRPRARTSPCRCGPASAPTCRSASSPRSARLRASASPRDP